MQQSLPRLCAHQGVLADISGSGEKAGSTVGEIEAPHPDKPGVESNTANGLFGLIEALQPMLERSGIVETEIVAGLECGAFEIHFPKRFTRVLRLLRLLPYSLYFPAIRRLTGL